MIHSSLASIAEAGTAGYYVGYSAPCPESQLRGVHCLRLAKYRSAEREAALRTHDGIAHSFFVVGRSGNSGLAAAAGGIWIANGNLVMQNSSMWNNSHAGSGLLQEESNKNAGRPFEALAARNSSSFFRSDHLARLASVLHVCSLESEPSGLGRTTAHRKDALTNTPAAQVGRSLRMAEGSRSRAVLCWTAAQRTRER